MAMLTWLAVLDARHAETGNVIVLTAFYAPGSETQGHRRITRRS
ncbi:MAG: hypothetical protein V9E82_10980 [Candidatus Nanopelagicales bacterium]